MQADQNRERWAAVALVVGALLPALLLSPQGIGETDPAQYAEVARHIGVTGKWGTFEDAFGPYLNKPPLTFWLIAVAYRLFGETSFAARLPSLLAGIGLVLCTWRLGRKMSGARTGTLAAAFTGSSFALLLMVADPKIDLILTACVGATVLCAVEARERPGWMWGAWLFGALGFLTKGPIGFAVPAFAVLPEAVRTPWSEHPAGTGVWARVRPLRLFTGPLVAAAPIVPFFVAYFDEWGWGGVRFHLWDQSIGRLLSTAIWRNDAGPFYFLHTALWAFLPFTPVLLFGLVIGAAELARTRRLPPDWRRLAWWWLWLTVLSISTSSYKLPQYLFPALPAAALVSARCLTLLEEQRNVRALRWLEWVGYALGGVACLFASLVMWKCFPLPPAAAVAWGMGMPLFLVGARFAAKSLPPGLRAGAAAVAGWVVFGAFFAGHLHPALLAFEAGPRLGELVRRADPEGQELPFVGIEPTNGAGFYARRYVRGVDAAGLELLLKKEHPPRVAILAPEAASSLSAQGFRVERIEALDFFPTSRPTVRFFRADTRPSVLQRLWVARVGLR